MSPQPDFTYHLQTFPSDILGPVRPWYDRLPVDPYIAGHFRRRRFSHFLQEPAGIRRLDHTYFLQSRSINDLAGGVKREFQEIEEGLIKLPAFSAIIATFTRFLDLDPSREIGVHQIRILCSQQFAGDPAPEGVHKDGFDFVGIFCVQRANVTGANTHLYREKDQPPIFSRTLQPGEVVFTNDRTVFHYTDPVHPSTPGPGHRDVFVLTA